MRRFDRLIANAFVPPAVLFAAGLLAMLVFWGLFDGPLPDAVRAIARWLPLLLMVAGFGWGLVATVRLWRRPRVEPVLDVPME